MKKFEILQQAKENYIFAVIRGESADDAYEISKALYAGGIKNMEVAFSGPGAELAIKRLTDEYADTDMVVGAGTVLDAVTARIAILNGAQFIVSPSFDEEVAKVCNLYAIPYLPGCGSVQDVVLALQAGCDVVKAFPGGLLGPGFVKDVKGPIPHAEIMPSGGVSLDNMADWVEKGVWAIGIGSALTKGVKENGYEQATENARVHVEKAKELLAK